MKIPWTRTQEEFQKLLQDAGLPLEPHQLEAVANYPQKKVALFIASGKAPEIPSVFVRNFGESRYRRVCDLEEGRVFGSVYSSESEPLMAFKTAIENRRGEKLHILDLSKELAYEVQITTLDKRPLNVRRFWVHRGVAFVDQCQSFVCVLASIPEHRVDYRVVKLDLATGAAETLDVWAGQVF